MAAFWDIGLCALSDFTDFLGKRVMTYTELKARHKGKVLTGRPQILHIAMRAPRVRGRGRT